MTTTRKPIGPKGRHAPLAAALLAIGGFALGGLLVTAPIAAATSAQDICDKMGGSYESHQASNGKTVESCAVPSGGGPVTGYWINGVWQGSYARTAPPQGNGHPLPPGSVHEATL